MKKITVIIMLFVLLFSLCVPGAFASNELDSVEENLIKLGYTKEEINIMKNDPSQKEMLRYANLGFSKRQIADFTDETRKYLEGMYGKLIGVETKYYRISPTNGVQEISKEQALSESLQYKLRKAQENMFGNQMSILGGGSDTETTSWMTMTTTVAEISGTNPKEYLIMNEFTWLTEPFWTLTDVVAISHPEHVTPIQNSELMEYTYDRATNTLPPKYFDTKTVTYTTADKKTSQGYAFKFDLKGTEYLDNGVKLLCVNSRGFMAYRAIRANPNYTHATAHGHYAHSEIAILFSLDINLSFGSFSVSGASKTTYMRDTAVTFEF